LSSISPQSFRNRQEIEEIKNIFRLCLDADNYSIIFTSGATESLNLAFKGIAFKYLLESKSFIKNNHNIVLSLIEHKAALEISKFLEVFDRDKLINFIDQKTIFLSLPYINNETGNCQPIEIVSKFKKKYNFVFHCDLTASLDFGPFSLKDKNIDIASFSSHKMCGIKGLGGIVIKEIHRISPIIHGGGQQDGLRGGTENFPAIKVWGEYLKEKINTYKKDQKKVKFLDDYCINAFKKEFKGRIIFNSFIERERIPGIINLSIKNIPNKELVAFLSQSNIFIGTGSACNNINFEGSKVLHAMGLSNEQQENILRISFDENNHISDFDLLIKKIRYFERNMINNISKLDKTSHSVYPLPDCESYRKIALKYWFNRIRKK